MILGDGYGYAYDIVGVGGRGSVLIAYFRSSDVVWKGGGFS